FQAEDGIRDATVTGVQTCALPISGDRAELAADALVVEDVLGTDRVDGDRADRAGGHAPALRALRAGVRRVGGVPLERGDANHRQIGRASCRERVWECGVAGGVRIE